MGSCKLENINKKFGDTIACSNVNLEIKENEFKFLLGPSGAGKTTILRILAGLEIPDTGRVLINDEGMPRNSFYMYCNDNFYLLD